jgi:16S rRNA (cytidine1402-2'-O)-methyltransferase
MTSNRVPPKVDLPSLSSASTGRRGRLVLMPNTLDLGSGQEVDLTHLLPLGAIQRAAALSHWVVENAKSARAFLKRVDAVAPLSTPLQALQMQEIPRPRKGAAPAQPEASPWRGLLEPTLHGHDIGLLSEAGLPAIADPGCELVAQAHHMGVEVEPWAGPSSLLMTLAASGLGGQNFAFVGYLPVQAEERAQRIRELDQLARKFKQTQIAIETPYRNAALMGALLAHLHSRTRLCVATGLTLEGGWCRTASVQTWRETPVNFDGRLPAVFAFSP